MIPNNNQSSRAMLDRSTLKLSVDFSQLQTTAQRINQRETKEKVLTYLQQWEEEVKDYHADVDDSLIKVDVLLLRLKAFLAEIKQTERALRQQQLNESTQSKLNSIFETLQDACTTVLQIGETAVQRTTIAAPTPISTAVTLPATSTSLSTLSSPSFAIDYTEFDLLASYLQKESKEIDDLIKNFLLFRDKDLKPVLEDFKRLSMEKETDRKRLGRKLSQLISQLNVFFDSLNDLTLTDHLYDEISIVISYVRDILEQAQIQLTYLADPILLQTLAENMAALKADASAKALYDKTLSTIKDFYSSLGYKKRTCFICYAWSIKTDSTQESIQKLIQYDESWVQPFLKQVREDLRHVGIHAYLDIVDNQSGNNIYRFMEKASSSDFVLLIGTESLLAKHRDGLSAVCTELINIKRKRLQDKQLGLPPRVYPILLSGAVKRSFPAEYELYSTIREWQKKTYVTNMKELIRTMYRASQNNPDYKAHWEIFSTQYPSYLSQQDCAAYYAPPPEECRLSFHHNLPPRNNQFVGRHEPLEQLERALQQTQVHAIVQTVQGLGGLGKTQLALEYAYQRLEAGQYQLVWWLNAQKIMADYLELADYLHIPANGINPIERLQKTKHKLAECGHWLLIIDDAEDYDSIKDYIPSAPGHILVTSRYAPKWRNVLPLDVFDRKESIELLSTILQSKFDTRTPIFQQTAQDLADLLGNLPLALAQAGAYIRETPGMDISSYIDLYRTSYRELWQEEHSPTDYQYTVATTWNISFKKVNELAPQTAQTILNHAAYLSQIIPLSLFQNIISDTLERSKGLRALQAYSLIDVIENKSMRIHSLVQTVIRLKISEQKEEKQWLVPLIQLLRRCIQDYDTDNAATWNVIKELAVHVLSASHYGMELGGIDEMSLLHIASMQHTLGVYYSEQGTYQTALTCINTGLGIRDKIGSARDLEYAKTLATLGNLQLDLAEFEKAEASLNEALNIFTKYPRTKDTDTLIAKTYVNLSNVYMHLEKFTQAEHALSLALPIEEKIYGKTHPEVALTLVNLGVVKRSLQNREESSHLLQRALSIYRQPALKTNPSIILALSNFAAIYQDLGDLDKEIALLDEAIGLQKHFYGEQHPDLIKLLQNLAIAKYQQGNTLESQALIIEARKILDTLYGNHYPAELERVIVTQCSYYSESGSNKDARILLEKLLEQQKRRYGKGHSNVADTMNVLAEIYSKLKDYDKAIELLKEALEILNQGHKRNEFLRAKCLANLGITYYFRNEYALQKYYLQQALEVKIKLYGENHYEAALTRWRYAQACGCLKQFNLQIEESQKALKVFQNQNPLHPDVQQIQQEIAEARKFLSNRLTLNPSVTNVLKLLQKPQDNGQLPSPEAGLRRAAAAGQCKELEVLIPVVMDINLADPRPESTRRTALHWAVEKQHVLATAYLVAAGARWDIPDGYGKTAQDYAASQPSLKALLEGPCPVTCLTVLKRLQKPRDEQLPSLDIALRRAAAEGQLIAVIVLCHEGADINAVDANADIKRTALHWAVIHQHSDVVRYLLEVGARFDIPDAKNKTAYDYAQGTLLANIFTVTPVVTRPS